MKAEVVAMDAEHLDMEAIQKAGKILKEGGLVAFPTETVYGLGGNALDPKASMKIYAAKGRPSDNPLIVHIADIDDLAKITTEIPKGARILAEKYWPGPLTMILPKADIVPKETTGGLDSVAVRFPSDRIAQELIKAAGGTPVLAHPKLIGDDELVRQLCQQGIEGIEAFYPQHDEEDTRRYLEMADTYGLMVSGGSDFHGCPTRYPQEVGIFTNDDQWAEPFYRPEQKLG